MYKCNVLLSNMPKMRGHYKRTKLLYLDDDLGGILCLALPSQLTLEICSKDVPSQTFLLLPLRTFPSLFFEQIQQLWKYLDLEIAVLVQEVEPQALFSSSQRDGIISLPNEDLWSVFCKESLEKAGSKFCVSPEVKIVEWLLLRSRMLSRDGMK
jgi:hypothetical protein